MSKPPRHLPDALILFFSRAVELADQLWHLGPQYFIIVPANVTSERFCVSNPDSTTSLTHASKSCDPLKRQSRPTDNVYLAHNRQASPTASGNGYAKQNVWVLWQEIPQLTGSPCTPYSLWERDYPSDRGPSILQELDQQTIPDAQRPWSPRLLDRLLEYCAFSFGIFDLTAPPHRESLHHRQAEIATVRASCRGFQKP